MTIATLTDFFFWCTVLNVGLFVFWALWMTLAPNLVYTIQSKFFPIERPSYDKVIYGFMGIYKLLIIIFNFIPFIALKFFIA